MSSSSGYTPMAFSRNSSPQLNSTGSAVEVLYSYPELVFCAVGFSILIVLAIIGNSLVLAAVARTKKLQNITNVFVVNLSVTDLLSSFAIGWTLPGLMSHTPGYPLPKILCVTSAALLYITISTSLFTLANIALNRCILVTRSMETYQWLYTHKKTAFMVCGCWLIPVCTTIIPPLSGLGGLGFDPQTRACKDIETHPRSDDYDDLQFAVFCPVPFLVIVISYVLIWRYVRRHFKKRQRDGRGLSGRRSGPSSQQESEDAHTSSSQPPAGVLKPSLSSRQLRRRMRNEQLAITKNLFVIVLVFILCVLPHAIIDVTGSHRYELYGALVLFMSCSINPLIYALKHPHFGPAMRALIRSRPNSENKSSSQKVP